MARPLAAWSSPAVGTLFSARHATTHASQPVQRSRSTTIPHLRAINLPGYRRQFWIFDFDFGLRVRDRKSKIQTRKSKIDSPPRAFKRLFAHPPGKKDQFARTHARNLYP